MNDVKYLEDERSKLRYQLCNNLIDTDLGLDRLISIEDRLKELKAGRYTYKMFEEDMGALFNQGQYIIKKEYK